MIAELAWYLELAKSEYADDYRQYLDGYGDTPFARQAAAECAFIQIHNALPDWGTIIVDFETHTNKATGERRYVFTHI